MDIWFEHTGQKSPAKAGYSTIINALGDAGYSNIIIALGDAFHTFPSLYLNS